MPAPKKQQQQAITESQNDSSFIEDLFKNLEQLPSLAEKIGVTQRQLKALYALGHELYHRELFEKAAALFRLLCFHEASNPKYWLALGASYQHTKNHKNALAAFTIAALHAPQNPAPQLYAAHSLIDLQDLPMSLECAQAAINLCDQKANAHSIKSRALSLRKALVNYLNTTQ